MFWKSQRTVVDSISAGSKGPQSVVTRSAELALAETLSLGVSGHTGSWGTSSQRSHSEWGMGVGEGWIEREGGAEEWEFETFGRGEAE